MSSQTENLSAFEKLIKVNFKNKELLFQAFIHRSYLNEARSENLQSNERLEFLGDAILSFWVSSTIFLKFPDFPEGKLTFVRTYLVKTETLTSLAKKLAMGELLLMSRGEEAGGGHTNPALLANSFEALIGAIFLDQGIKAIEDFLSEQYSLLIEEIKDIDKFRDNKSILQEQIQAKGYPSPVYKQISASGPDHQRVFTMGVYSDEKLLAEGTSNSKQEAEEAAAKKAITDQVLENLPKIK